MIFIIRAEPGQNPRMDIKMARSTPGIVPDGAGKIDLFCLGDPSAARADGWTVVPVHDGWYADDGAGGMAIWGHGLFWEVRDTPFTVKQACGPEAWPSTRMDDDESQVNVRQSVFQG